MRRGTPEVCTGAGETSRDAIELRRAFIPREDERPPHYLPHSVVPTSHPSISSRTESAAIQSMPTSRPATTGHTETPAKPPTSRQATSGPVETPGNGKDNNAGTPPSTARITTSRPTLVEYFTSFSHLPGDLQEALLRAFLAQDH